MSQQVPDAHVFSNQATYPPRKSNPEQRRWYQFGLKGILLTFSAFALLMGCLVAPAIPAIAFSVLGMVYAASLTIAVFYGRGWIRPYAICGLLPIVFSLFLFAADVPFHGPEELLLFLLITFFFANLIGFSGAITHGFLSRRSGKVPVPNIWFLRNWLSND